SESVRERAWPAWLALAAGIAVASYAVVAQNPPPAEPDGSPRELFSAVRAMTHVEAIAREPHPTGSASNGEVREVILKTLKGLGFEPEIQTPQNPGQPERNILA